MGFKFYKQQTIILNIKYGNYYYYFFFGTQERHPLKDRVYEDSITTKRELIIEFKKKKRWNLNILNSK